MGNNIKHVIKLSFCVFLLSVCIIGCTNTYNHIIRNYSGQVLEQTDYCDVRIVNNELDYKLVKQYLNTHNYVYYGYSYFSAKTNFGRKHAEKLCKKLGGYLIVMYYGNINTYWTQMSYINEPGSSRHDYTYVPVTTQNISIYIFGPDYQ